MPTDLSCPTCEGSGRVPATNYMTDRPIPGQWMDCPDCGGSGVAAWAVEVAAKVLADNDGIDIIGWHRDLALLVLAAVREEAKNQ